MKRVTVKKVVKYFSMVLLIFALFLIGGITADAKSAEVKINYFKEPYLATTSATVNFRNSFGSKIGVIPEGQEVLVKGICYGKYQRVWVEYSGREGSILSEYVERIVLLGVTTSELNQRDSEDNIIQCIPEGEIVILKEEAVDSERIIVEWNEKQGSVLIEFIEKNFILINLEEQKLSLYQNSRLVFDTPTVTGTDGTSRQTPTGAFSIQAMSTKTTLRGPGYASYVEYWMPFYKGYGIHDADGWRSQYGGDIYKTNGSHGCVNLPLEAAKTVYENTYIGMPVIIK